jgi:hypothetical protein
MVIIPLIVLSILSILVLVVRSAIANPARPWKTPPKKYSRDDWSK